MMYQVYWTDFAKEDYANILNFLQSDYGVDTALKFLDKTEKIVTQIERFPFSFPTSSLNVRIRRAVINKNTSLVYKVNGSDIDILFFWDNRMKESF